MPDPNELLSEMLAQAGGEEQQFPAAIPPLRPQTEEIATELPAIPREIVPQDPLQSLIGAGTRNIPAPPKEPTLKRTKKEMFRDMLSTFVYSLASGLQESRGPGGNARGAAAALLAPYEREVRQHKMALEDRRVAVQEAQQSALEDFRQQQAAAITPSIEVLGPNGEALKIAPKDLSAYISAGFRLKGAQIAAGAKKETTAAEIASKEKIAFAQIGSRKDLIAAQTELAEAQAAVKRGEIDPASPLYQQKERALQARIQAAQASQALQRERLALQTQKVVTGAGLTNATRTMIETAPTVLSFIDRIKPLVEKEASGLGPIGGRWREFMAGKVGVADPEFKKLKDSAGLLSTLLLRMHVGARGSNVILQHFKDMLDTGKQSPENLLSTLEVIEDYANDLVSKGQTIGPQGGVAPKATHRWNPATGRVEPIGKR